MCFVLGRHVGWVDGKFKSSNMAAKTIIYIYIAIYKIPANDSTSLILRYNRKESCSFLVKLHRRHIGPSTLYSTCFLRFWCRNLFWRFTCITNFSVATWPATISLVCLRMWDGYGCQYNDINRIAQFEILPKTSCIRHTHFNFKRIKITWPLTPS
jgi:hypothetical protein